MRIDLARDVNSRSSPCLDFRFLHHPDDGNIEMCLTIRTHKYFASIHDVYSRVFVTPSMKVLADAMHYTFLLEQGAPLFKLILILIMYFLVY